VIHYHVITLFPDFFKGPLDTGILARAGVEKAFDVRFYHLAEFKEAPNKRVDDILYGGGAGMVYRPEVIARAIEQARLDAGTGSKTKVIHFTPRGKRFTQAGAERFARKGRDSHLILLCGRYEGIDQRVIDGFVDLELRVGDVVLSGGEYAALFFMDAVTRLIPGVLGNDDSIHEESFSRKLGRKNREYPQYTRPGVWRGKKVPDVLVSGDHKKIEEWRKLNLKK
jgi:tRNA (guanine37-N1)-methyltransferase